LLKKVLEKRVEKGIKLKVKKRVGARPNFILTADIDYCRANVLGDSHNGVFSGKNR
jgi:hypothetical protein